MYRYITRELVEQTHYKELKEAYETGNLSIVNYDNVCFWTENTQLSKRGWNTLHKEMNRLFPHLKYFN